jgi:hypothetical protein
MEGHEVTELMDEQTEETAVEPDESQPVEPAEEEAEAEEATPEPDEPETEAQASGPTPEAMEKFYKGVETRRGTFNRWVGEQLGDAYLDLSPCPLCADSIPGLIFPPAWITPTSDTQARLLDVLKTPTAPEYQPAPHARRCGTCDGWGAVLSGSRIAGKDRVMCPTCKGNGYQGEGAQLDTQQSGNGVVAYEPPADHTPVATGDTDIWGSPRLLDDGQENPNYGKMVQYKDPTLP